MSVLIVGSVALDSIETPKGKIEAAQGGSASYASAAASYWCNPHILAVIGDDYPQSYLTLLRNRGVQLEPGLEVVEGGRSFHWSGLYKGAMNEAVTRETDLGVFENFNPQVPDSLSDSSLVLLGNIDPTLQLRVLDQLKNPSLVVVDTMNLWIEIKRDTLMEVLKRSDLIVLNDGEARLLGEEINLHNCARNIRKQIGEKLLIIKKGEHGATLYTNDARFSLPAFPINSLSDPTGAGDSFAGGFLGCLDHVDEINEDTIKQAMVVGTVMASFCVEDFSLAYTGGLSREKIEQRLKRMTEFTCYNSIEMPKR
jgi:sugar/nucleoside kinase (ribokinase family)